MPACPQGWEPQRGPLGVLWASWEPKDSWRGLGSCVASLNQIKTTKKEKSEASAQTNTQQNNNHINHNHILTIKTDKQDHALLELTLDLICLQLALSLKRGVLFKPTLPCLVARWLYCNTGECKSVAELLHKKDLQINWRSFSLISSMPDTIWSVLAWSTPPHPPILLLYEIWTRANNYKYFLTQIWSKYTSEKDAETQNKTQRGVKSQSCREENVGEERSLHLRFLLCMSLWEQGGWGSGGVWSRTVSVSVSQGNYTPATWMKTEDWIHHKHWEMRWGGKDTNSKTVFWVYKLSDMPSSSSSSESLWHDTSASELTKPTNICNI